MQILHRGLIIISHTARDTYLRYVIHQPKRGDPKMDPVFYDPCYKDCYNGPLVVGNLHIRNVEASGLLA